MTDFTRQIKELGQLGTSEGEDAKAIKTNLAAVTNLIPYIKILERKRLNVHFETPEEYDKYFAGEEFNRLFRELIISKLRTEQILLLLREKQMSASEISEALGMSQPEVNGYLNNTTRQGLVRYDEKQKVFVAADIKEPVLNQAK
jgi:predicted XRE-type DNA-binding protein